MNTNKQSGFGIVAIIVGILVLVGLGYVGYRVYTANKPANTNTSTANNRQTGSTTTNQTPNTQSQQNTITQSDEQQIADLAKALCTKNGLEWIGWAGATKALEFSTDKQFARASTGCNSSSEHGSGFTLITKKVSGSWEVIYNGQEVPGKAWGAQYNAPSGWYDSSY